MRNKLPLFILALNSMLVYAQSSSNHCDYFLIYNHIMPDCNPSNYVLMFEDNFDGNSLDLDVWELQSHGQGALIGSPSQEVYTLDSDNLEVSNGTLKIMLQNSPKWRRAVNWKADNEVLEDGEPNLRLYDYSSSSIWTKKKMFREGKYEIRFKLDGVSGMWPAFWTFSGGGGPAGDPWNELDIFEIYYDNKWKFTTNVHYDYNRDEVTSGEQCNSSKKRNHLDQWRTVTCYFDNDRIRIYLDNKLMAVKYRYYDYYGNPLECGDGYSYLANELYGWPRDIGAMVLNMAMQNSPDASDDASDFPCTFEIDYVKYWQKSNCQEYAFAPSSMSGPIHYWLPLYTGWDARILPGAKLLPGQQSQMVASNSVESLGNLDIEIGANFEAWIDPNLCQLYKSTQVDSNFTEDELSQQILAETNQDWSQFAFENEVYPNPFFNEIIIEASEEFQYGEYAIYDMLGNLIDKGFLNDVINTVNGLESLPAGMYSVVISKEDQLEVQKLFKQ